MRQEDRRPWCLTSQPLYFRVQLVGQGACQDAEQFVEEAARRAGGRGAWWGLSAWLKLAASGFTPATYP